MSDRPLVAVVVLTWNGREDTLACLASLERITYKPRRIVVVDNGSTDGTVEAVEAAFPSVAVVRLSENRGFTGGMNAGLREALDSGAEYVLALNNDITVAPDFVEPLVHACAADPKVGAACSQVLFADPPDRVWYAGAELRLSRGHQGRHTRYGARPLPPEMPPYVTDRACAAAILFPREALERVGLLDEELFAYGEDVDWSLRARAEGLHVLVVPASVVRHKVSASSGGEASPATIYYDLRNGLTVLERHAPLGRARTALRQAEAVAAHAAQALLRSNRRRQALRAVWRGWRDFRHGRLGPMR